MDAPDLFESVTEWLRRHYSDHRFFAERDIVWTVQTKLNSEIESRRLPYRVFNDYRIAPRRLADLVILHNNTIEVAVEFKYEPSHSRSSDMGGDIMKGKFPVVFWNEVEKDVRRVQDYVALNQSTAAYSILIDESKYFRWRDAPSGSEWIDWTENMSILWSQQWA